MKFSFYAILLLSLSIHAFLPTNWQGNELTLTTESNPKVTDFVHKEAMQAMPTDKVIRGIEKELLTRLLRRSFTPIKRKRNENKDTLSKQEITKQIAASNVNEVLEEKDQIQKTLTSASILSRLLEHLKKKQGKVRSIKGLKFSNSIKFVTFQRLDNLEETETKLENITGETNNVTKERETKLDITSTKNVFETSSGKIGNFTDFTENLSLSDKDLDTSESKKDILTTCPDGAENERTDNKQQGLGIESMIQSITHHEPTELQNKIKTSLNWKTIITEQAEHAEISPDTKSTADISGKYEKAFGQTQEIMPNSKYIKQNLTMESLLPLFKSKGLQYLLKRPWSPNAFIRRKAKHRGNSRKAKNMVKTMTNRTPRKLNDQHGATGIEPENEAIGLEDRSPMNTKQERSRARKALLGRHVKQKTRHWHMPKKPWNLKDVMRSRARTALLRTLAEIIRRKTNAKEKQTEQEQQSNANIQSHFQRLSR